MSEAHHGFEQQSKIESLPDLVKYLEDHEKDLKRISPRYPNSNVNVPRSDGGYLSIFNYPSRFDWPWIIGIVDPRQLNIAKLKIDSQGVVEPNDHRQRLFSDVYKIHQSELGYRLFHSVKKPPDGNEFTGPARPSEEIELYHLVQDALDLARQRPG